MTDNEIIAVMSNMLYPISKEISDVNANVKIIVNGVQELKSDVDILKTEVKELRTDVDILKTKVEELRTDVDILKDKVTTLDINYEEIKNRVINIELTQENIIVPRIQEIEGCYISTYDRYKNSVEEYEIMKQDICVLKNVVSDHSMKLQSGVS